MCNDITMTKNIIMTRGDTFSFGIDIDDMGQDLEKAFFTVKKSYSDTDDNAILQKSLSDGISKVGDGEYVVRVAPEDTVDVDAGNYYYDCMIGVNGDVFTILSGMFTLEPDVTLTGSEKPSIEDGTYIQY